MPNQNNEGGRRDRGGRLGPLVSRPARCRGGVLVTVFGQTLVAFLSVALAAADTPPTLPAEELTPGARGVVTTVFAGTELETIEVEILGVEPNGLAPGVPIIFCRFVDERGRWTGVAAGMSGSPVSVDGKIIGALSYTIGSFTKEPICGITPIESMLALERYPAGPTPREARENPSRAPATLSRVPLAIVAEGLPPGGAVGLDEIWATLSPGSPVEIVPTVASGTAHAARASAAGAGAPGAESDLSPGSAVAALLVWGDMKVGATGTVTWRDGERILAFGHPFTGIGRAEFPIAPARVVWTVPSLLSSFKIASIGDPVGMWEQDRLTAIGGRLGPTPAGLPLSVTVARPSRPVDRFEYWLARDPFFLPLLADFVARQAFASTVGAERSEALRMAVTLRLAGGKELTYFASGGDPSGNSSVAALGSELSRRLANVSLAPFEMPELQGIDVRVDAVEPGGGWIVARALPDRVAARPGETVRVTVDLEGPWGLKDRRSIELELPDDVRPGRYTLLTGSSAGIAGEFGARQEARRRTARNADEYLAALEDDASPTRLVAVLARQSEGIVTRGRDYLALPSTAHLMLRSRPGGAELYRARWLPVATSAEELERPLQRIARTAFTVLPQESPP